MSQKVIFLTPTLLSPRAVKFCLALDDGSLLEESRESLHVVALVERLRVQSFAHFQDFQVSLLFFRHLGALHVEPFSAGAAFFRRRVRLLPLSPRLLTTGHRLSTTWQCASDMEL